MWARRNTDTRFLSCILDHRHWHFFTKKWSDYTPQPPERGHIYKRWPWRTCSGGTEFPGGAQTFHRDTSLLWHRPLKFNLSSHNPGGLGRPSGALKGSLPSVLLVAAPAQIMQSLPAWRSVFLYPKFQEGFEGRVWSPAKPSAKPQLSQWSGSKQQGSEEGWLSGKSLSLPSFLICKWKRFDIWSKHVELLQESKHSIVCTAQYSSH